MVELSSEAKKRLLELQKQLRLFLKSFANLEKSSTDYEKHASNSQCIQALYLKLSLMDLTIATPVEVEDNAPVSKPKTSKADRKARRENRKEERKDERKKRREKRNKKKIQRIAQKDDVSGAKEECKHRYDKLKADWEVFGFDKITHQFRDYLCDAECFVKDGTLFIEYAETYSEGNFEKEIEGIKELIEKTNKFLVLSRNIDCQVEVYSRIVQDLVTITLSIPRRLEDLKDDVVSEAQKIFAAAKQYIATADITDDTILKNVEKLKDYLAHGQSKLAKLESLVGLAIADEDENNLPDWYDKLSDKYQEIIGDKTSLIPGTSFDDKILLQINALKSSLDKFIEAASDKVEELKLEEKLKNAQQWLGELNTFISAITGFAENISKGDLFNIYEDLKEFKNFIDNDRDILQGTNIDDKIKDILKEHSKKAETWLMNFLTGGDPDKETEVRSILSLIDRIILSTGGVVDHSGKYQQDEDKISLPDVTQVSETETKEIMEKHGIIKMDSSFEGILSDMKDEADGVLGKVATKYKDAVTRGAMASSAFKDAKDEYDQALEKHIDYFKATNEISAKIIKGLLGLAASAFSPAVGAVVTAAGNIFLHDFDALNDQIIAHFPENTHFIGDLSIDILPMVLPKWTSEEGLIKIEGEELLAGLYELYSNGITVRYKEVYDLLNSTKGKASSLGKNLRRIEQVSETEDAPLVKIKKDVIVLAKKWQMLSKDVEKKYVNLPYPPINKKRAYKNASRYLYAVWLIRFPQKEIRIGNTMIKQFNKFGVMKESGAKWNTDGGALFLRSVSGVCGADPFDFRLELKKMKKWASSEYDSLKSAKAWEGVF